VDLGPPVPVGNGVGSGVAMSQQAVDNYGGGSYSPRGGSHSYVPPLAPSPMVNPQVGANSWPMSNLVDPRFEDPFSVHVMPGAPDAAQVPPPGSACAPPPGHMCAGDGRMDVEERLRRLGCGECADCGKRNPDWASITFGTVICAECAAVHNAMVKKRRATDASMFSHLWGEQGDSISEVRPLREEAWTNEEVFYFQSKGGNGKVNAELAKRARMLAPMPPPDTLRADIDKHIARKYGGQLPKGRIPPLQQQRYVKGAPPPSSMVQARGGNTSPLPPTPSRASRTPEPGLVVVEVFGFDLAEERAEDLRGLLNPMPLSLTACLCIGRALADPTKASKATKAVFDPPARRELPWDLQEAWLWCRLEDDNIITGSRLAAVTCIDMLAVVAMSPEASQSSADVVAELYAWDEDEDHPVLNRAPELTGVHGSPGAHGPLGRHTTKEREDWNFLFHGLRCGSIHLRVTLVSNRGH